jgi:hypothetical protein
MANSHVYHKSVLLLGHADPSPEKERTLQEISGSHYRGRWHSIGFFHLLWSDYDSDQVSYRLVRNIVRRKEL